jgi:tetratricopeptide (TPR) repeat protein
VDVDEFRKNLKHLDCVFVSLSAVSAVAHGLRLYEGDLLEDWDAEWCLVEREELRRMYTAGLLRLAEAYVLRHRYDWALEFAQKAVLLDSFNEEAQIVLARVLHLSGNRIGALSQIRKFVRLVRSELGVQVEQAAIERLAGSDPPGGSLQEVASDHPFVGRELERAQVRALMVSAGQRAGGGVLLVGDAGIGKSRLVEWAQEEWAARGGMLARATCIEFTRRIPYQAVTDVFRDLGDDLLVRLARELAGDFRTPLVDGEQREATRRSPRAEEQRRSYLFRQISDRLRVISENRPILLTVEDLHWGDPETVDFLSYLCVTLRDACVMVVMTARAEQTSVQAKDIGRLGRYCRQVIRLKPLGRHETERLVDLLAGRPVLSAPIKEWIFTETEGNPLFVCDVVRAALTRGVPNVDKSKSGGGGLLQPRDVRGELPEVTRNVVEWRFGLISRRSRRVAGIAAVLGRSFEKAVLASMSLMDETRLNRYVDELIHARILEQEGTSLRFCHGKIQAWCYEMLPSSTRVFYHKRAATILAGRPAISAGEVARHWALAGDWQRAACLWEQAGCEAIEAARYEEARSAFECALVSAGWASYRTSRERDTVEFRLLVQLDRALVSLGRIRDREKVLIRMERVARGLCEAEARAVYLTQRALYEEHVGNLRVATALAKKAYHLAHGRELIRVEPEALRALAWALNREGKHRKALVVSRLYLRRFRTQSFAAMASVLRQAASTCIWLCDYAAAEVFLHSADVLAHEYRLIAEKSLVALTRSIMLRFLGRVEAARGNLERALVWAKAAGDPAVLARAVASSAVMDILEGRLGSALVHLRSALAVTRWAGSFRIHVACLNLLASGVARLLGDYEWACRTCERAVRRALLSGSFAVSALCRDTQALLLIEQGLFVEALQAIDVSLSVGVRRDLMAQFLESLPKRAVILLGLGEVGAAVRDLEEARRLQERGHELLLLVDTLTWLAVAYASRGDLAMAAETSEAALEVLVKINHANPQPQRIYWHHYLILKRMGLEPRMHYLQRAVELIEARAATLSRAQQRRFRRAVPLNRDILAAWEHFQQNGVELTVGDVREAALSRPMQGLEGHVPVSAQAHPAGCVGTVS